MDEEESMRKSLATSCRRIWLRMHNAYIHITTTLTPHYTHALPKGRDKDGAFAATPGGAFKLEVEQPQRPVDLPCRKRRPQVHHDDQRHVVWRRYCKPFPAAFVSIALGDGGTGTKRGDGE